MSAPFGERLRVHGLLRDQLAHVEPVAAALAAEADVVIDEAWSPAALLAAAPDVVLCVNDWPAEVAACLDAARAAGVPTLVLQDGILEWRCQYENPLFGAGGGAPQHQPVLADKIACIGRQSARQIAAWGNAARVELTGMPRLDALVARGPAPRRAPGARVLVMTAKSPGFTDAQRAVTLRSLQDLRRELAAMPDVVVRWRIAGSLVAPLGVANEFTGLAGDELAELLRWADAVVCTPSTAMLEAMLLDRPVAALDYHNVPRFVPTAWTIAAPEHVPAVLRDLLAPSERRMAFQRDCLADCLETDGPAAGRVAELVRRMAVAGRRARAAGTPRVTLPPDLLGRGLAPVVGTAPAPPDLAALYPEHPDLATVDVDALRVRAARLRKENEHLRRALRDRTVVQRLLAYGRSVARRTQVRAGGHGA